ncbi:MAG: hypothetical protein OSJ76_06030 [Alphaproteobacteria bacterium]|nr:hypothetical protein [Alphaproteobacteria bacterium]
MINLDDNNQPVSPEIGKFKVKDYTNNRYTPEDDKDFHIKTIRDEALIDYAEGLDDQHEFALDMFDRGEASDLPDSDRQGNCHAEGIDRKTCFDKNN